MGSQEITGRQVKDATISEVDLDATAVGGAQGWFHNLAIVRATTTNAGDSVKLTSADGSALSSTNYGTAWLPSTSTPGLLTKFTFTGDTTMLLSGMTPWGDGLGNLTGAILRILLVNDNGTARLAAAYLGGRTTLLTTDTTATPASVTLPEHVLCNVAISSASNTCREIGYVRLDFTDSTNVVAIQTGVNDVVTGQNADGRWQPWVPNYTGFSSAPTDQANKTLFCQIGSLIYFKNLVNSGGTSNSTLFKFTLPAKSRYTTVQALPVGIDNGTTFTGGSLYVYEDDQTAELFKLNNAAWTSSGVKYAYYSGVFFVGPVASFIE